MYGVQQNTKAKQEFILISIILIQVSNAFPGNPQQAVNTVLRKHPSSNNSPLVRLDLISSASMKPVA